MVESFYFKHFQRHLLGAVRVFQSVVIYHHVAAHSSRCKPAKRDFSCLSNDGELKEKRITALCKYLQLYSHMEIKLE